jgi:Aminotransferase class-III
LHQSNEHRQHIMDDLANHWGCCLVNTSHYNTRNVGANTIGERALSEFKAVVSSYFYRKYYLARVMTCGSDANLYSIADLTQGDTGRCLVAAGCYLAGDDGPLQSWSTSTFSVKDDFPEVITHPDKVKNMFTKTHTIGLPYHMEGVLSTHDLITYENMCFLELHNRCILANINGTPFIAILLELILASNGAILSHRALVLLGELAAKHNFYFIVDEIMTGGRTGSMLMMENTPIEFSTRVTHVTMGKWLQVGIVLETAIYHDAKQTKMDHTSKRGTSTIMNCTEVITIWNTVADNLNNTKHRREQVLKKLKLCNEDVWGKGLLIFANIRRQGAATGGKFRYLPMLTNTPIDSVRIMRNCISKQIHNQNTVMNIKLWLTQKTVCNNDNTASYRKMIIFFMSLDEGDYIQTKDIKKKVFPQLNLKEVSTLLRTLQSVDLLDYKLKGDNRTRHWKVLDGWSFKSIHC